MARLRNSSAIKCVSTIRASFSILGAKVLLFLHICKSKSNFFCICVLASNRIAVIIDNHSSSFGSRELQYVTVFVQEGMNIRIEHAFKHNLFAVLEPQYIRAGSFCHATYPFDYVCAGKCECAFGILVGKPVGGKVIRELLVGYDVEHIFVYSRELNDKNG